MSKCVICYQEMHNELSFRYLFFPKIFCDTCYNKLEHIINYCPYCSHPIGFKCCDKSIYNTSIYFQNQFLKDCLYHIKYYNLQEKLFLFEDDVFNAARQFEGYSVVYVPLSSIMKNKRGFNQSYILASFTKLEIIHCLERVDNITQSQKNYYERINNPPKFKLKFLPKNKNILIVDDIYTTGTTLKTIINLFPKNYNIKCLTLQRTILK